MIAGMLFLLAQPTVIVPMAPPPMMEPMPAVEWTCQLDSKAAGSNEMSGSFGGLAASPAKPSRSREVEFKIKADQTGLLKGLHEITAGYGSYWTTVRSPDGTPLHEISFYLHRVYGLPTIEVRTRHKDGTTLVENGSCQTGNLNSESDKQ